MTRALVAGAGPAGLACAASLRRRGVEVVVLERSDAVAARWRTRYDGLRLNTMRQFSGLPGRRIPRAMRRYPSRDDFVRYLEDYARGLDVRFGVEARRVEPGARWRVQTSDGTFDAEHVVIATGYDAVPFVPEVPGDFGGERLHASEVRAVDGFRGRDVLIVGGGNTGVDLAGVLDRCGARVAVAMRSGPLVVPRDLLGLPLQPSGLLNDHLPVKVADALGAFASRLAYGDLTRYGVPKPTEGYQTKFRRTFQGPAVDDGFVAALEAGRARAVPNVERFDGNEAVLVGGERLRPDVVIFATGYRRGLEPLVGHLGVLDDDGRPTHHAAPENPKRPGLYFAGFDGRPSGQIRFMPRHARSIARAVSRASA